MDAKKAWDMSSISIAAVSLALGAWSRDGAVIALSCFAVLFSAVSLLRCSGTVHRYSMIMSVAVLICTVLCITVLSYGTLVEEGGVPVYWWVSVNAVAHGMAIIPLTVMFFFTAAALFNASYNWALLFGLSWMVGTGFQLPMCLSVFVVQISDLQHWIVTNNGLVVGMIIGLFISVVFSLVIRSVFEKNRYLITANGLTVRR